MKDFYDKVSSLKDIVPIKFRIGTGVWYAKEVAWKKVYESYSVLPYIDARDCMDRLDTLFWPYRQRSYNDIAWKAYCSVSLRDWNQWISKSDVWDPTAISKNKWEASDSFKRACYCRWLGRFLYTMPKMFLSKKEIDSDKYNIKSVVMKKFWQELREWNADRMDKMDMMRSKYNEWDEEEQQNDIDAPDIHIDEATEGFTPHTDK